MVKKYTLDTPLNPDAFFSFEIDNPIVNFRELGEAVGAQQYETTYDDYDYLIFRTSTDSRVVVDLDNSHGKYAFYKFKTFEEAINAHLILTNPDMVVGDLIMINNDRK